MIVASLEVSARAVCVVEELGGAAGLDSVADALAGIVVPVVVPGRAFGALIAIEAGAAAVVLVVEVDVRAAVPLLDPAPALAGLVLHCVRVEVVRQRPLAPTAPHAVAPPAVPSVLAL